MSQIQFRFPQDVPLIETFNTYPSSVKAFLRHGLSKIASFSEPELKPLIRAVMESLTSGHRVSNESVISVELGLNDEEVRQVLAAGAFLAAAVSSQKAVPDQLAREIIEAGLIHEERTEFLARFVELLIEERDPIRQSLAINQLGSEVLPTLTEFAVTVDVRLGFTNNRVDLKLPLLIVHLDTDAMDHEAWFQLTRPEVEKMIADLQDGLTKIEQAELWLSKR